MNRNILLVEDEPGLVLALSDRLRSEGYKVMATANGVEAVDRAAHSRFDLIILDLMLPSQDGLEACREVRQRGVGTPILMLTEWSQTADKVLELKTGSGDYLTKPFNMLELLARVEALLRRAPSALNAPANFWEFGAIRVDLRRTEVSRDGEPVALSAKEFQLLRYLIQHQGITLSRERLLTEVWGYSATPSTRTVDVHVAWLRQKLEDDPKQPRLIVTVHGFGYKFAG